MAESRSKKVSVMIFLLAIFILLMVFTGGWVYRMYKQQTEYTQAKTLSAVECGKYYFDIDETTVTYDGEQLYFEIENTLGSSIDTLVVESGGQTITVEIGLIQGITYPVSVPLQVVGSVSIYPEGCAEVNFKNITFEPNV